MTTTPSDTAQTTNLADGSEAQPDGSSQASAPPVASTSTSEPTAKAPKTTKRKPINTKNRGHPTSASIVGSDLADIVEEERTDQQDHGDTSNSGPTQPNAKSRPTPKPRRRTKAKQKEVPRLDHADTPSGDTQAGAVEERTVHDGPLEQQEVVEGTAKFASIVQGSKRAGKRKAITPPAQAPSKRRK